MIRKTHNGVVWLEFELFQAFPLLKHGIFLRHGGASQGNYASLNLSFGLGDDFESVNANHAKIKSILQAPSLSWAHQVHGTEVHTVDYTWSNGLHKGDGLVTNHLYKGLLIHHADCQAAIMYDPRHHVVANIHCGWRGNVKNIYASALKLMRAAFGSKPEDVHVGISPSLGPQNAEFINYRTELPEHFWEYQFKPTYFDFWSIAERQLMECGVLASHIQVARICTYDNPQDYYSYRFCKLRGGHGTLAMLI